MTPPAEDVCVCVDTETDGSELRSCSDVGEYDSLDETRMHSDWHDADDEIEKESESEKEWVPSLSRTASRWETAGAALLDAAGRGDAEEVERLMREVHLHGISAAAVKRTLEGETPLALAVRFGNAECVRVLLHPSFFLPGAGSARDLTRRLDLNDNTALHRAVSQGDVACCEALLEGGACPLAKGALERTPLHLAVNPGEWRRRWWRRHCYGEAEEEYAGDEEESCESAGDEMPRMSLGRLRPRRRAMTSGRRAQRMRVAQLLVTAAAPSVDPR